MAKKLRNTTQWPFYFWRSFKTWQKVADSLAMTFCFVFGNRLKLVKNCGIRLNDLFFKIVWKFVKDCEKEPWKILKVKMGHGYKKVENCVGLWLREGSTFIDKRNKLLQWFLQWTTKKLQLLRDVPACYAKSVICKYQPQIFWVWAISNGGYLRALHKRTIYEIFGYEHTIRMVHCCSFIKAYTTQI